jgi:general secretion pathway protein C
LPREKKSRQRLGACVIMGELDPMSFDATMKRFFPLIICALIALAAYFQASGIGDLVASAVSDTPAPKPTPISAPAVRETPPNADPILKRNPFDSVTGPLDGVQAPTPPPQPDEDEEADGEPDDSDPSCSFGNVTLIMASEDPAWSFASIVGNDGSKLRRVGDKVDDHTVEALAWDRVWLAKDKSRCQLKVGDDSKQAKARKPVVKRKPVVRNTRGQVPAEIAGKIHKISDNEFNIERSVVDQILEQQAELMRFTRMRPVKDGDKVVGLRMSRIRGGTLLDVLGLKNGDQIQSINGFELTDPQKALEAYGRLRTADKLSLSVTRGGKAQSIDYNIQ